MYAKMRAFGKSEQFCSVNANELGPLADIFNVDSVVLNFGIYLRQCEIGLPQGRG